MRAGITLLVLGAALLVLSACEKPLLSGTSEFGSSAGGAGGSSSSSQSEEAEEEDPLAVGGRSFASVSECLVGMWDVDPLSYADMIGSLTGQPGGLKVQGAAEIDFRPSDYVASYTNWQVIFSDPQGTMTQTTNGKETAQWSVDANNRLTSTTISDTTQSTLEVKSPEGSMVFPTGGDDEVGVEYSDFVVTCEADTARLDGSEGYLVLNRR
jgi:hypothetical protein